MNEDTDSSPLRKRIWQVFWILFVLEVVGIIAWLNFVERRAYPFRETFVLDRDRVEERRLSWLAWGRYDIEVADSSGPPFIAHSGALAVELISDSGEMVFPRTWVYPASGRFAPSASGAGILNSTPMKITTAEGAGGPRSRCT